MSRYFAPIEAEILLQKIHTVLDKGMGEFHELFKSDLKVKFDFENFYMESSSNDPLMGIHTLSNGFTFCGMSAGGDWETPVYFIVYFDGKKLRAYIPTDGNPWNTDTKQAYGNDLESDYKNAQRRWPNKFNSEVFDIKKFDNIFESDNTLILKDIQNRILPFPSKQKTLQERIEELTFYGTGDESYELFQQACSFCYSLYGLGSTEQAEIVYEWAKIMAEDSYKFAQESGNQEFLKDAAKGRFEY